MHELAEKILTFHEPDPAAWDKWCRPRPLSAPSQAAAMQDAAARIRKALEDGEKILVAGDYDADGILGTALLVEGLRKAGGTVGFYIPDRLKEGYGLQPGTLSLAKAKGYGLVISVDNGVKAHPALALAREEGLDVIVTDHHAMEEKPDADWIVHPSLLEEEFSTLCGAGVAYELLRVLGLASGFSLQLAGVASVADMMPVTGQTRSLIQEANRLWNTCREPHLAALCKDAVWDETTISFQIAPKINAVGRLSDRANANNVVRWLLSGDPAGINAIARSICSLNEERKRLSEAISSHVSAQLKAEDKIHFVAGNYHEGIVGLAASRLSNERRQPVIVGALRDGEVRCSMRAPEGFDCAAFVSGFPGFTAAGGHAGAAGFTFPETERAAFQAYIDRQPDYEVTESTDVIPVSASQLDLVSIQELDLLRPFGPGFKMPEFRLENPAIKSILDMQGGKHRRYTLWEGPDCLRFNCPQEERLLGSQNIRAFTGRPQTDRFAGKTSASFLISQVDIKEKT